MGGDEHLVNANRTGLRFEVHIRRSRLDSMPVVRSPYQAACMGMSFIKDMADLPPPLFEGGTAGFAPLSVIMEHTDEKGETEAKKDE